MSIETKHKLEKLIDKYNKCLEKKCNKFLNESKKADEDFHKTTMSIREKLHKGNISFQELQKLITQKAEEISKRVGVISYHDCGHEKCKKELLSFIDYMIDVAEQTCKMTKAREICDKLEGMKKIQDKIKDDKLTTEDTQKLIQIYTMMKFAVKRR